MCGIAGWANFKKNVEFDFSVLQNMTNRLIHRGPDDCDYWRSEKVMFGHRRLVIMDTNGGKQPMTKRCGDKVYSLVFNGEIYNYKELKKELIDKGHVFTTKCDTEVLLEAWIEWGESSIDKLNGIYAFGIWEEIVDDNGNIGDEKLFLVRDRLGIKSLYISYNEAGLIFSSELYSLMANPYVSHKLTEDGLKEVLAMSPSKTPGVELFEGVRELMPAEIVVFNDYGIKSKIYWKLEDKKHSESLEETSNKLETLFVDAVERQLQADVPLACFLSGGLDSSAVCSVASNAFKRDGRGKLPTYSIEYVDNAKYFGKSDYQPTSDEEFACIMSKWLDTEHTVITIDNEQLAYALLESVKYKGYPGMADVDSSLMLVCREISKNHKVILSGECADEIFGGYPWFWREDLVNLNTFPWLTGLDEKLNCFEQNLVDTLKLPEYVSMRYEESINEVKNEDNVLGLSLIEQRLREISHLNHRWFMLTLLDRKDKMSMAAGIEARVPFGDHELAEYAWNIPWDMKLLEGREKGLLRNAFQGLLPEIIYKRKKSPYPKSHNPQYEKITKQMLQDIISSPSDRIKDILNIKKIEEMMKENSNIGKPWFGQLMARPQLYAWLIQLDEWLRIFEVEMP